MPTSIVSVAVAAAARRLATTAALAAELDAEPAPTTERLEDLLDQASGAVERYCRRVFARETLSQKFRLDGSEDSLLLARRPVVSITSVTEDDVALAPADYEVDAGAGILYRLRADEQAFWQARKVVVVFVCGFLLPDEAGRTLPAEIERATLMTATSIFEGEGRDLRVRSESVEGVDAVTYLDPREDDCGLPQQAAGLLATHRATAF